MLRERKLLKCPEVSNLSWAPCSKIVAEIILVSSLNSLTWNEVGEDLFKSCCATEDRSKRGGSINRKILYRLDDGLGLPVLGRAASREAGAVGQRPSLFAAYVADKRAFEAGNELARASDRFGLTARGKINTYALFAELFSKLIGPRGRVGVIVPTGIATDATTAPFFASLIDGRRLASLIDFENRDAIFPARFIAATNSACSRSAGTSPRRVSHSFDRPGLARQTRAALHSDARRDRRDQPQHQDRAGLPLPRRCGTHRENLRPRPGADRRGQGQGRQPVGPVVHGDVPHVERQRPVPHRGAIARVRVRARRGRLGPPLSQRERGRARTPSGFGSRLSTGEGERYVPLYEAKMGDFFDHRAAGCEERGDERGYRVLPETSTAGHSDPGHDPMPYYWVPEREVADRLRGYWGYARLFGLRT
jgi:hypothetical protein